MVGWGRPDAGRVIPLGKRRACRRLNPQAGCNGFAKKKRLAAARQRDPARRRNEELRADHVLQPLDLPADRRLAGVGDLGGAVERLGLGDGEKDAQLSPELSTEQCLVVERTLVECVLFLVECLHGFPDRVEMTITYSLAVFSCKSPLLC